MPMAKVKMPVVGEFTAQSGLKADVLTSADCSKVVKFATGGGDADFH